MFDWLKTRTDGWKTYGTVWSAVLVLFADGLGWYDVPGLEVTPQGLVTAVLAALAVTFGKSGLTREIRKLAGDHTPPEA